MSSTSPPNTGIQLQFVGNNDLQGYREHSSQPYSRNDDLSQPFITKQTPPFLFRAYPPAASSSLVEPPSGFSEDSHPPTGTALVQHSPGSSGVQSGSHAEHINFQLAPSATPVSLPEAPPMRYFHTDLAVLSAEQYNEGHYSRRPASKANLKPNTTVNAVENAPNPKKRGRKAVETDQGESTEEVKRTRGRPRLETKDQTPTERRRTQIRLAQRAYRNRKENAITDLQEKIDNLKEVNKEINSAYQNLFDYASQRGLLTQAPEFGQQLQRLQTLIKETQDKNSPKVSDQDSSEENPDDDAREAQSAEDVTIPNKEPATTLPEDEPTQLWGGLTVSHEPVVQQEALATTSHLHSTFNNPQPQQYEIVTAPNPDNASFGLNFSADASFINPAYSSWAQHPWNRLTGPRTMAFNEWSFARRLHRHAVERAAALISLPNPPPSKISRVFGFVMLFETMDEIRTRTMATLARVRDEPLNYWEHPFHRLGGSGTHFSYRGDGPSSLSGSSNYESSGFGMGPFNEPTMRVRDTLLGVSQYINMSGWEGTWFDSGEVETYLAQNGIIIPPSVDIHTVELQPGVFSDVHNQTQIQLMQTVPPHPAPTVPGNQPFAPSMPNNVPPMMGGTAFSEGSNTTAYTGAPSSRDDPWAPISVTSTLFGTAPTASRGVPSFTGFDNVAENPFLDPSPYAFPQNELAAMNPPAPPKRVVLDVNRFIGDLINHATCLGRAPAFRPKDIATSFWSSVIAD